MPIGGDELARLIFNYDDVPQRLTQDSPVAADVWARYDEAGDAPVDLILVPHRDRSAGALTSALRDRLARAGATENIRRFAYAGTYVTARLTLPEMVWVALPLTRWWNEKLLAGHHLVREQVAAMAAGAAETERDGERLPIARQTPWLVDIAGRLTWEAAGRHGKPTRETLAGALLGARPDLPTLPSGPPLLWEIDVNRPVRAALWRSRQAVKADVAERTFQPDITDLGWAVLDSGVDARHPAFRARGADGRLAELPPKGKGAPSFAELTRVVRTYDFTRLRDVLEGSLEPVAAAPGKEPVARKRPPQIDEDLHRSLIKGRSVDWALIEPHIRVEHDGHYRPPLNPHGTHVAGIIGGDWHPGDSAGAPEKPLRGIASGLDLYDLRVLDDRGGGEEFAVLAALAFLRWLNTQSDRMLVHGVNLSLSLDHDVLNSACGRSPVCVEATRAHESGIVVVAAAGNAGQCDYSYQGVTAPGYRTVSITDPGNADAVITVGATHRVEPHTYGVSYFSSRGPTGDGRVKPDLVAPGEKIVGPLPGDRYARMDGTSMAAPHVSGAAALLMGRHRELIGEPDVSRRRSASARRTSAARTTSRATACSTSCARWRACDLHARGPARRAGRLPAAALRERRRRGAAGPHRRRAGPAVYGRTLGPRLAALRPGGGRTQLRLAMISHIDDDHIAGIADLLDRMRERVDDGADPEVEVGELRFDAFERSPARARTRSPHRCNRRRRPRRRRRPAARARRSPRRSRRGSPCAPTPRRSGSTSTPSSTGSSRRATREARRRRRRRPHLHRVRAIAAACRRAEGQWQERELAHVERRQPDAQTASYVDGSVCDLSSIVVLAQYHGHTMLLTGDARGDHVLGGLQAAGKLDADGRVTVDVPKLPHHGSSRNVAPGFFTSIRARHYGARATGASATRRSRRCRCSGRPRRRGRSVDLSITYGATPDDGHDGKPAQLAKFFADKKADVRYGSKGHSVVVDLADPIGKRVCRLGAQACTVVADRSTAPAPEARTRQGRGDACPSGTGGERCRTPCGAPSGHSSVAAWACSAASGSRSAGLRSAGGAARARGPARGDGGALPRRARQPGPRRAPAARCCPGAARDHDGDDAVLLTAIAGLLPALVICLIPLLAIVEPIARSDVYQAFVGSATRCCRSRGRSSRSARLPARQPARPPHRPGDGQRLLQGPQGLPRLEDGHVLPAGRDLRQREPEPELDGLRHRRLRVPAQGRGRRRVPDRARGRPHAEPRRVRVRRAPHRRAGRNVFGGHDAAYTELFAESDVPVASRQGPIFPWSGPA